MSGTLFDLILNVGIETLHLALEICRVVEHLLISYIYCTRETIIHSSSLIFLGSCKHIYKLDSLDGCVNSALEGEGRVDGKEGGCEGGWM